ncbi:MAG: hypothetical protein KAR42_10315 [candidate division Zixibacteria bacterium]|nr:hypothetical protein [candidate division Zixibacteria bacterium]
MSLKRVLIALFALSLIFTICGCSEDDDPISSGGLQAPAPPVIQNVECPVGMAASTNPYATYAENYLLYLNAFTAFDSYITPASNAVVTQVGDTVKAVWTSGTLEYDVRFVTDGGYNKWFVYLDGNDGPLVYSNQLYIEARIDPSSNNDGYFMAHPNPSNFNEVLSWSWETVSGIYRITYTNSTANSYKVTRATDGSGIVEYLINSAASIVVTWVPDGNSGTWNNISGSQTGTWQL